MKNIIKIGIIVLISSILLFIVTKVVINESKDFYTDKELNDYYEDLYGDGKNDLEGLTDEQLEEYYENLYGPGNNDVVEKEEEHTTSLKSDYVIDEEQEDKYIEYIANNYKKAYMIRDTEKKMTYNKDHQGDYISLTTERGETKFSHGIAVAGANVCITYTDVMAQGYEKFSGYFGAHFLARTNNSTATSFTLKFACDGVITETQVYNKDTMADYIEIDLDGVEVFQIFVDTKGSGSGDYVGMGDPKFTKSEHQPYLSVFDLEFNLPSQVTQENLLQYAKALDLSGKDISSDITVTTNHIAGEAGDFEATYTIKDVVDGVEYERNETVKVKVLNIDYSQKWTVEDFKIPYADYLYHARQSWSPQMKKLFDLLLEEGLNFDSTKWKVRDRSNVYKNLNYQSINLQSKGIYLHYNDVNKVLRGLWDCEPRIFMILNLDLMGGYYTTTNNSTGLLSHAGFWAQNLTTAQYNQRIEQILSNSERFLEKAKPDMTYAQKWRNVIDMYAKEIHYNDGGSLYNSIGLLKGKCNGNSQGLVFLAQRLNMQSIYSEGESTAGFHAWSYQKLPDDHTWYMTDRLWGGCLNKDGNHGHKVNRGRGYTFPPISQTNYASSNYTYPSVWANFKNTSFLVNEGTSIDILGNINGDIQGIFDDSYKSTISAVIKDNEGNIVSNNTTTLSSGKYTIVYTIKYKNDMYDITRDHNIDLLIISDSISYEHSQLLGHSNASWKNNAGVWNGSSEDRHQGYNINNAGFITFANNNYNTLSLKFNTTEAVRNDNYAKANCKIALEVYYDGVLQTTTASITAYSKYIQLNMYIPEGVSEIKLKVKAIHSASAHGCIADIKFGQF